MQILCDMVGANFRPTETKEIIKSLRVGDILTLEREADNPYDKFAVRCVYRDEFLGFIPKDQNYEIAAALDAGEELTAEIVAFQNSLRPSLSINLSDEYDDEDEEEGSSLIGLEDEED